MDSRKYEKAKAGKFLKKADLRSSGPLTLTITAVEDGEGLGKDGEKQVELQLVFADGTRLGLSTMENLRRLQTAFGFDTDGWIGHALEVYFSPDVPNPKNSGNPGGIRLRALDQPPRPKGEPAYVSELDDTPL